jgi:hypothetical protein
MPKEKKTSESEQETVRPRDPSYWLSRTPEERMAELERLRQEEYGYDPNTARMVKVITVLDWPGD